MLNWDEPAHPRISINHEPAGAQQPVPRAALGVVSAELPSEIPPTALRESPLAPIKPEIEPTEGGATGLEDLSMGAARISVDDKQMINCRAG